MIQLLLFPAWAFSYSFSRSHGLVDMLTYMLTYIKGIVLKLLTTDDDLQDYIRIHPML
jgi:hypothetical protein